MPKTTMWAIVKIEVQHEHEMSADEIAELLDASDYSFTLDQEGVKIVDTTWEDTTAEYPG